MKIKATHRDKFRAAYHLARADQRGECLCIGAGNYYPNYTLPGRKYEKIMHLILRVYSGVRPRGAIGLHSCDNKACINPDHLRWGSYKQNHADSVSRGRDSPPPLVNQRKRMQDGVHHWARLKPDDIKMIRIRLANGEKPKAIADDFGVGFKAISKIKLGQRWGYIE